MGALKWGKAGCYQGRVVVLRGTMDSQKHICCNRTPVQPTKVRLQREACLFKVKKKTASIVRFISHHINHSLMLSFYLPMVCL